MKSVEFLKKCLEELENMSQEEFDKRYKERGLDKLDKEPDSKYRLPDGFRLILGDKISDEYGRIEEAENGI